MNPPDPIVPGEVRTAQRTLEGEGVEVLRLFPVLRGRMNLDPFVLFDHFFLEPGTGFPTHPHRGFEAITYLFDGGMRHRDNLGNDSLVTVGGAQRFTAGRGIEHSEMPDGKTRGIQLWINLPRARKHRKPGYQAVPAGTIPVRRFDGGEARVIVGPGSPLQLQTPVHYEDIRLDAGGETPVEVPAGWQGFVYVVDGAARIDAQALQPGQAMTVVAGAHPLQTETGVRALACLGRPHGEPVYQHGPWVD